MEAVLLKSQDLAENFGPLVSSLCRRMIYNEELAREAAQEAWVQIMRGLPSFRGESQISTWIFTVTRRTAMRLMQNEQRISNRTVRAHFEGDEFELPAAPVSEQVAWVKEMCSRCLTGVLSCLSAESRMSYIFRDVLQLEYAEIGEIMGGSEESVRRQVARSRRRLKYFLDEECMLSNPAGRCSCRMKKAVAAVDLPKEYADLRKTTLRQAGVFRESEEILQKINYWREFLRQDRD